MPRWDSASKNKQRQLIQQQQPWQKSTGPRSEYGRLVSSQNAVKKKRSFLTDVSSVSQKNQEGDTDRPLQIGDRVSYIGGFQPTFDVCGGQPLKVVGFDEVAGAIACRTAFGKIIWIYPQDLQRCLDGQRKHD